VYAKAGVKRIVGRGVVTGDYYFDNRVSEYKHRHTVDWTSKGSWDLREQVAQKTLTNFNDYPDFIVYMDQLINGEPIDEKTHLINEFRVWLSQQVQQNGELLNDKTITQKISSLKDIEKEFNVLIFGETDTEALKNIKETVLNDDSYDRYKGVSGSSIDYYIRYVESRPSAVENESYSKEDFLSEVFINEDELGKLQSVLQNKKNLILKGAPGVGKTFIADRLAYLMMEEKDDSRIQMIQFHQSYSYEDFIEGYRPKADGEGFELKQGPFVKFARKASRDPEREYFFIIDEVNRGNMSKIFGELMMLIETDKRGKSVNLLYSNEKFSVPSNLYIIGMMNTADRSLALLDYALRRRFSFYDIAPAFENSTFLDYINSIGSPVKVQKTIDTIKSLNKTITEELGKGFQIGHSYFVSDAFTVDAESRLIEVIEYEIIPQLYEYWFDDEEKAEVWANKLRATYYGE
jgi:5-methylcytosine-specific restriction protein B